MNYFQFPTDIILRLQDEGLSRNAIDVYLRMCLHPSVSLTGMYRIRLRELQAHCGAEDFTLTILNDALNELEQHNQIVQDADIVFIRDIPLWFGLMKRGVKKIESMHRAAMSIRKGREDNKAISAYETWYNSELMLLKSGQDTNGDTLPTPYAENGDTLSVPYAENGDTLSVPYAENGDTLSVPYAPLDMNLPNSDPNKPIPTPITYIPITYTIEENTKTFFRGGAGEIAHPADAVNFSRETGEIFDNEFLNDEILGDDNDVH